MPQVRGNASAKWVRRASSASGEYEEGVKNPRRSWQQATVAAAPVQAAAIQQAIADKRFEKGVAAAGDASWSKGAIEKGVSRFGQGVAVGESNYQKGVQPYLDKIGSLNLPPRGPKGDPKNLERVKVVANALRALKVGRG